MCAVFFFLWFSSIGVPEDQSGSPNNNNNKKQKQFTDSSPRSREWKCRWAYSVVSVLKQFPSQVWFKDYIWNTVSQCSSDTLLHGWHPFLSSLIGFLPQLSWLHFEITCLYSIFIGVLLACLVPTPTLTFRVHLFVPLSIWPNTTCS